MAIGWLAGAKYSYLLNDDPRFDGVKDLSDIHPHKLVEIRELFEVYKRLEPRKWVKFKSWGNAEEAKKLINYAINLYRKNI